jgi:hypothetical protein
MNDLLLQANEFCGYVLELTRWLKEKDIEFSQADRLAECGTEICSALKEAEAEPGRAQEAFARVVRQADVFCGLISLLVETDILTEFQSRNLLSLCLEIKREAGRRCTEMP